MLLAARISGRFVAWPPVDLMSRRCPAGDRTSKTLLLRRLQHDDTSRRRSLSVASGVGRSSTNYIPSRKQHTESKRPTRSYNPGRPPKTKRCVTRQRCVGPSAIGATASPYPLCHGDFNELNPCGWAYVVDSARKQTPGRCARSLAYAGSFQEICRTRGPCY